jgi:hypothetical protein
LQEYVPLATIDDKTTEAQVAYNLWAVELDGMRETLATWAANVNGEMAKLEANLTVDKQQVHENVDGKIAIVEANMDTMNDILEARIKTKDAVFKITHNDIDELQAAFNLPPGHFGAPNIETIDTRRRMVLGYLTD